MYYLFHDADNEEVDHNNNRDELLKKVRAYYKGEAMDKENIEYEIDGRIITMNQFDEEIHSDPFYEVGNVPSSGREKSPYQQSEFI